MNKGKICVSVCAKTADELITQIKLAENLADVIEIRFDCLDENELEKVLDNFPVLDLPLLATFRTQIEGGKRYLSLENRLYFWNRFSVVNKNKDFFADFEADTGYFSTLVKGKHILSTHIFKKVSAEKLESYYEGLSKVLKDDILKIAVVTKDITDTIPIWQLLKRAKDENKDIIPIAMGESGKWTRILGLANGAFMTYASLDSKSQTAPGQITAQDLIEIYRAKELDENTEIYGILGNNTSVSMSPYIHNTAFKFHNLNAVFVPLQTHNLDEFIKRMVKPETREIELNFKGFSVTIPHKQTIIKHLDFIDETAEKIGAVNTVKIIDGKLYGYNTDAKGFIEPLKQVYGDLNNVKVAVLGAGGASRACVYALQKEGAEVDVLGREEIYQIKNQKSKIKNYDIIVNATPLGMRGKFEGESPLSAEQMKGVNLVYDLVYIPFQTQFTKEADIAEVPKIGGVAMLIAQAIEQQRIWTGLDAPMKEMSAEVLKRLK